MIELFEQYERMAKRVKHEDGDLFWTDVRYSHLMGKSVGKKNWQGYRVVHDRDGRCLFIHRLIFFIYRGVIPKIIDHIDGDIGNNRMENLRIATRSENAWNKVTLNKHNVTGVSGVTVRKSSGKWSAYIYANRSRFNLGLFDTLFDAACARRSAELSHHAGFRKAITKLNGAPK